MTKTEFDADSNCPICGRDFKSETCKHSYDEARQAYAERKSKKRKASNIDHDILKKVKEISDQIERLAIQQQILLDKVSK